jgi:DNA-binding NtrC family response regulator
MLEGVVEITLGIAALAVSLERIRQKEAESIEKPYLNDLLTRHGGNVSAAAAEAKVTRKVLYRMAKKFDVDLDSFR